MNNAKYKLNFNKANGGHSVAVISATMFVIIIFGILLLYEVAGNSKSTTDQDFALSPIAIQLRDIQARDKDALSSYKMLDKAQGIVHLPIERAMQLVVDESVTAQLKARSTRKD